MTQVASEGVVYANIYSAFPQIVGPNFVTGYDSGLQISLANYNEARGVPRHSHHAFQRTIHGTEEVLVILDGEGTLSLYSDNKDLVAEVPFASGTIIHLLEGGHELKFHRATKLIEVKQGPYVSVESDKHL